MGVNQVLSDVVRRNVLNRSLFSHMACVEQRGEDRHPLLEHYRIMALRTIVTAFIERLLPFFDQRRVTIAFSWRRQS